MTSSTPSLPSPNKIVPYYITDDPNGGALFLYGNPDSSNIAIFCAGFPDDHEIGQAFCSRLAEENKTFVGLMCLPGYDDRPDKPWEAHKTEGYTFKEMTATVREAVKVLRAESTNDKAKLTGIFHDWGVLPGTIWANQALEDEFADSPDQLVLFDVLGPVHKVQRKDSPDSKGLTVFDIVVTLLYRFFLATAFGLQLYVSKYIALLWHILANTFLKSFNLGPVFEIDYIVVSSREKKLELKRAIYMAYPYFYMFKAVFSGKARSEFQDFTLTKDLKKTPILYLYGPQKRAMFHDNRALKYLEREAKENRSKSKAIAVEGTGHWLYIQQPDICLKEVMEFMTKE